MCFCNTVYAEEFFKDITDKNFREKVSVWELDNYHFYEPQPDDMWKICTEAAKEGNNITFDQCKLKAFKKKSDLDVKYYQISFDSTLPIKKEWLETVMQEVFNQEGFSYFTVYQTKSTISNHDSKKTKAELDYKKCVNNTHPKNYECIHNLDARVLAYNDPNALRNGVVHDAGQKNGGLFMFYDIYTSTGVQRVEENNYLWVADYTKQAWEIAQKVDPSKNNPKVKYNIERYSESILSKHDNEPVDFSNEFRQCKKRFTDKNNGRFSEQDECYCNCVQDLVNEKVKKLDNPNKLVIDIIETSYGHCDWRNSTMVNHHNKELADLLNKDQLSKYDECRLEIYMKYTTPPVKEGSINICNVKDVTSHMMECSSIIFKK